MLLQQGVNLIRAPQMVVDLARLGLSYRRKLDCAKLVTSTCYEAGDVLFSLLSLVESMVLLRTLTASPQASFRSQSSL
jgi:hypothetical protein